MERRHPWWRDGWLWGILLLGLGVRLIGIDEPLIDGQAWRQADTAAIARNFYEEGFSLFYPRVDWRGTTPGYVETNFPLFPFVVSCLYLLAGGVGEWLGRLLAALCYAAAAGLLYGLARRLYADLWTARLSGLLLLLWPLGLFFGRAFMPEAAMILLSIGALLAFERYSASERLADLFLAAFTAACCFLVKIPTLYLGFPLVALAWARWGWGFLRRPALWGYLFAVLLPPFLWYWHAHRLFGQTGLTFGIWNDSGYDKWISDLLLDPGFYGLVIERLGHEVFTPPGLALVLLGASLRMADRREWVLYAWLGGLLLYLLLVPEGNRKLHYYQLPFSPPGALLAGKLLGVILGEGEGREGVPGWLRRVWGCRASWRRIAVGAVVLAMGGYSAWAVRPFYHPPNNIYEYYQACHAAGRVLDRVLPPDVLLVVGDVDENAGAPNRAQSPTMLYYCHRKGWQITPDQFSGVRLDSLAQQGADLFIAAGGFLLSERGFWMDLMRRGVTVPGAYPEFWTEMRGFEKGRRAHPGAASHFVVVRLRQHP